MRRYRDADGKLTVCGEVNAKNSYGGYTGWKAFIISQKANVVMIQPALTNDPVDAAIYNGFVAAMKEGCK